MTVIRLLYLFMLVIGVMLICISRGSFTWNLFLSAFPIAAVFAASYFWIRLDVWRSDNTIQQLLDKNKAVAIDLISKRTDSRMALFLIVLAAIAQALWLRSVLLLGILLVLVPIGNFIARTMENAQSRKFFAEQ